MRSRVGPMLLAAVTAAVAASGVAVTEQPAAAEASGAADVVVLASDGRLSRVAADGSSSILAQLPSGAWRLAPAPDGDVLVLSTSGTIWDVDLDDGTVTHVADIDDGGGGLATDRSGHLYLGLADRHGEHSRVVRTGPEGGEPVLVADTPGSVVTEVAPDGDLILAPSYEGQVTRLTPGGASIPLTPFMRGWVTAARTTSDGGLLFSSVKGLHRVGPDGSPETVTRVFVNGLDVDEDGTAWGTFSGDLPETDDYERTGLLRLDPGAEEVVVVAETGGLWLDVLVPRSPRTSEPTVTTVGLDEAGGVEVQVTGVGATPTGTVELAVERRVAAHLRLRPDPDRPGVAVASLPGAVRPGSATAEVRVTYLADDTYDASGSTYVRRPPVVTTSVESAEPRTRGWYRTPVTVRFHCEARSAAVVSCPAPVTRTSTNPAGLVRDRALAADGGTTTGFAAYQLDRIRPGLRLTWSGGRPVRCRAVDRHSGPYACRVTLGAVRDGRRAWRAVATDVAGNVGARTGSVRASG